MRTKLKKAIQLITIILIGIMMVATVVAFARRTSQKVFAAGPIPPPVGYPKLTLSTKVVSPTVAALDEATLTYTVKILNTGAFSATDVTLVDTIPPSTTYNNDVESSALPAPMFKDGMIVWEHGEVGFDSSVEITFSVTVTPGFEGTIENSARISDPMMAEPVTVTATTNVTDQPIFKISKTASPALPGKNKPLTYELVVTNVGRKAVNTPIVVSDIIPMNTTFLNASPGYTLGKDDPNEPSVMWTRPVSLSFGETTEFTFSVEIGDVPSGTVINNDVYAVVSTEADGGLGEPYTTTVVDPILILSKSVFPDPPGGNSEMTYTLTVLNLGSMATDLVISDTVPTGVEYIRGGNEKDGVVSWGIPSLDSGESAQVTYTVYVGDVADIIVENNDYEVCARAEGVCADGIPTPSYIVGPTFEVTAKLDPIAHKPGGGSDPKEKVTPTLTIRNLGPGDAIDATALLTYGNISVSNEDVFTVKPPGNGTVVKEPSCNTWANCYSYFWSGNIDVGEVITITTIDPQSTIGGEEWTPYTATVVVTDALGGYATEPITATAVGHVTHMSNLIPIKTAPSQIGPGQAMTYTIQVVNSGLSTEAPPVLTETVPASVTLDVHSLKDGGTSKTSGDRTVITWPLPDMGPGDSVYRSFSVVANPNLVSGTLIINDEYQTSVYESYIKGIKTIIGEPVTTTVHEVGLIDSYKTVSPAWALPGTDTVLTYTVHVVNSSPNNLSDVKVTDIFPWQHSTYQRDAVASGGVLDSDIVSFEWIGDVASYSEQLITFTVVVDDLFEGELTNTATITHESLLQDKEVTAVAYITNKPVLQISKIATPDPVMRGSPLLYQIGVTNLGQQATLLVITDTIPANTDYIVGSASSGGMLVGDQVQWHLPVLKPGDSLKLTFQVRALSGYEVTNASYRVNCNEGVSAVGEPVTTQVTYTGRRVMLPIIVTK
jgi:uncharacterized repeat protein (TIGR01451 family)